MYALNQLVGYVKHINSGVGTVLYRGQNKLYPSVVPSIKHDLLKFQENQSRLESAIKAVLEDEPMKKFFGLKTDDVLGWNLYQKLVTEAILQHYGSKTHCVDFVDNHWTALWFGLYEWNSSQNKYVVRNESTEPRLNKYIRLDKSIIQKKYPKEPTIDLVEIDEAKIAELKEHASKGTISFDELIFRYKQGLLKSAKRKWVVDCKKVDEHNLKIGKICNSDSLYLFLYVADTNVSDFHGLYLGKNTYTIDLRKALPSTFLRPCSQHGWIVRGKIEDFDFRENIACVIQVNINLANQMLGNGSLLSQDNFFPKDDIDQGYNVLLQRQEQSRLSSSHPKILPPNTITDFYLNVESTKIKSLAEKKIKNKKKYCKSKLNRK